ncbi:MAG: hypothetical protein A6F71_08265 [Cycloclasticus sp. symbiont of Poecilosclerida sp. M]|nr:MAG: hypothetical protein A6F71_08265 [Cycloclasticus sp. symbiont of Poecilosclerida sp. M]
MTQIVEMLIEEKLIARACPCTESMEDNEVMFLICQFATKHGLSVLPPHVHELPLLRPLVIEYLFPVIRPHPQITTALNTIMWQ